MSSNPPTPARGGPDETAQEPVPVALRALAAVVALEALVLTVLVVLLVAEVALGRGDSGAGSSLLLAAITAACAAALVAVIRGLLARRRWSRAPALVTQLLALPIGWALVGTVAAIGASVMVVAAIAIFLVFAPAGGGHLER